MLLFSCMKAFSQAFTMSFDIIKGYWKLSRSKRSMITVFGGHKVKKESQAAQDAYEFSKRVVQCNYAVLTGGGPGIMKYANQGAYENKAHAKDKVSFCVTLQGLDEGKRNQSVDVCTQATTFFSRKLLLIEFSKLFIFFPGSLGTADEFLQIMVLMQTGKMKRVPVVLYDKKFWEPCLDWFTENMAKKGYMTKEFEQYFKVVDSVQEAVEYVQQTCDCSC